LVDLSPSDLKRLFTPNRVLPFALDGSFVDVAFPASINKFTAMESMGGD